METIFISKTNYRVQPFDLLVKHCNTEKYGSKSLMALGPKMDMIKNIRHHCGHWKYWENFILNIIS